MEFGGERSALGQNCALLYCLFLFLLLKLLNSQEQLRNLKCFPLSMGLLGLVGYELKTKPEKNQETLKQK